MPPVALARGNDLSLIVASITSVDQHVLRWIVGHRVGPLNPVFKVGTPVFFSAAILVGLSRLYLGVHYPTMSSQALRLVQQSQGQASCS